MSNRNINLKVKNLLNPAAVEKSLRVLELTERSNKRTKTEAAVKLSFFNPVSTTTANLLDLCEDLGD